MDFYHSPAVIIAKTFEQLLRVLNIGITNTSTNFMLL